MQLSCSSMCASLCWSILSLCSWRSRDASALSTGSRVNARAQEVESSLATGLRHKALHTAREILVSAAEHGRKGSLHSLRMQAAEGRTTKTDNRRSSRSFDVESLVCLSSSICRRSCAASSCSRSRARSCIFTCSSSSWMRVRLLLSEHSSSDSWICRAVPQEPTTQEHRAACLLSPRKHCGCGIIKRAQGHLSAWCGARRHAARAWPEGPRFPAAGCAPGFPDHPASAAAPGSPGRAHAA